MASNDSVPPGIVCTLADYIRSRTDAKSMHCLTRGETIGLTIVTQAGLLSLVAVSYVFSIILRNVVWRIRHLSTKKLHVFHNPMDLLMFSLFTADVLQAIGAVMSIKWIHEGKVHVGEFCNSQGIVQQLGETGVAMTTLLIAVYTFLGIWLGKDIKSMGITRGLLMAAWGFIALMTILGNVINRGKGKSHFQSPTPYWCWISEDYLQWRIWGEYVWFWITLAFSFIIYIPLYLWARGNIDFNERTWWKFTFRHVDSNANPELKEDRQQSLVMLAYPFVYCVSILPLSIVRWIGFIEERGSGINRVSSAATLAVGAIYGLSGACNVALLLTTRPDSGLFGKPTQYTSGRAPSLRNSQDLALHRMESYTDGEDIGRLPSRS